MPHDALPPPAQDPDLTTLIDRMPDWARSAAHAVAAGAPMPDVDALIDRWLSGESAPAPAHTPTPARAVSALRLRGVVDIQGVGALVPSGLDGLGDGLNVVLGMNGSGKSSFHRMLANACGARNAEPIRGNVYDRDGGSPSATIALEQDGVARTLAWVDGALPELAQVRVYDEGTGDAYLEKGVQPNVVPGDVQAIAAVSAFAKELAEALYARCRQVVHPLPISVDAEWGARLSDAKAAELDALALTPNEAEQLALLRAADANGPHMRQRQSALRSQHERLDQWLAWARKSEAQSEHTASQVRALREELARAEADVQAAAHLSSRLEGPEGEALRRLAREAARVCPDHQAATACALCARTFAPGEQEAYRAFLRAANDESSKRRDSIRAELGSLAAQRYVAPPAPSPSFEAAQQWTRAEEEARAATVRAIADSAPLPERLPAPFAETEAELDRIVREIGELDAALDPGARGELRADLETRELVARHRADLEAWIRDRALHTQLEQARTALDTRALSALQKKRTEAVVTKRYREGLARELDSLLPDRVGVRSRVSKGQPEIVLALTDTDAKPTGVLSEGERRAVGLAFFLAEASVLDDNGPLVLDDPVSSMDSDRRDAVASRLVGLAKSRQVIVFTHDLVFVEMLVRACDRAKAEPELFEVRRTTHRVGMVREGVSLMLNTKHSVGLLRATVKRIEDAERRDDLAAAKSAGAEVNLLARHALERLIEERMFGGVIQRFRRDVRTNRLHKVCADPEAIALAQELMTTVSMAAHDSSNEQPLRILSATQAKQLINRLEELGRRIDAALARASAAAVPVLDASTSPDA